MIAVDLPEAGAVDTRTADERQPPHGWSQESWDALCASEATRQANVIFRRARRLLRDIGDFLCEFGEEPNLKELRAANAPLPSCNLQKLAFARQHFAGVVWCLEQMTDCVADVLPPRFAKPRASVP